MKKHGKLISFILAAAMLFALLPTGIIASAEIVNSGKCGDDLTWELDSDGNLTITGTGDMWDDYLHRFTQPWCYEVKSITIGEGVTRIGGLAFFECSVTRVSISDTVKSIGFSAFSYCSSLKSVSIPASVTTIENNAFSYCTELSSVSIPDSVTTIENNAFYNCVALSNISIPDSVTKLGGQAIYNTGYYNDKSNWENGVLYNGKWLISVGERNYSGSCDVKEGTLGIASDAFSFSGLTSIRIPDSVEIIGLGAFYTCDSLTSVELPDSLTSIGQGAFMNCVGLTSVTIPKGVKTIEMMTFHFCTGLTSVTIPSTVTVIKDDAFHGCTGLTSLTIPKSVTEIGTNVFTYCYNLTLGVYKDSYGYKYAVENDIPFELLKDDSTCIIIAIAAGAALAAAVIFFIIRFVKKKKKKQTSGTEGV